MWCETEIRAETSYVLITRQQPVCIHIYQESAKSKNKIIKLLFRLQHIGLKNSKSLPNDSRTREANTQVSTLKLQ